MNKTIIFTLIIILGLAGLIWWGSFNQKSSANLNSGSSGGLLTADETVYDFGQISMKDGNVTKEFIVKNPTDKDIFVPTVVTSCMCTKAFIVRPDGTTKGPYGMPSMGYVWPSDETVKAGESMVIRVVYDPNAHGPAGVGFIDRFVTVTDEFKNDLKLEIKATVTP
jgi:hypothetical protein